jgi:hypothetical protein
MGVGDEQQGRFPSALADSAGLRTTIEQKPETSGCNILPMLRFHLVAGWRPGFRSVLIGNGVLSAFIMMSYALFRPTTPHFVIVLALLSGGFFRSLQFTALGSLAYADVPNSMMSDASSLSSMAQQLFLSLGAALGAMLLHMSLGARGAAHLSVHDFTPAFVVMGILALLSSLLFIPLEHHAGAEVSGRRTGVELSRTAQAIPEAD